MKAILPVAGVGSRLRPLTHTQPKALVHVAGKPILGHILDKLQAAGVDEVVLIVGYLGEKIVEYVRSTYPMRVHVVDQPERKGLGHAIFLAEAYVDPEEPVLIVLGDTIVEADLQAVVGQGTTAIGVKVVDDPSSFGVVELDGKRIVRLVEKPADPPSNLAVVGVYYIREAAPLFNALRRVIEDEIKVKGEYQLTDALQIMIDQGEVMEIFPIGEWLDCGSPDTLLATNRILLGKKAPEVPKKEGCIIIPPVSIDPAASLEQCVIGPYVSIAGEATIARAVIKNSIINLGATVEQILLSDSIVGEQAVVTGTFNRIHVGDNSDIRSIGS